MRTTTELCFRQKRILSWFVFVATILCATDGWSQDPANGDAQVLKSLRAAKQSFSASPSVARPFEFEARVTFTVSGWLLFRLQSDAVSIQAKAAPGMRQVVSKMHLGDLVRVSGVTAPKESTLQVKEIEVVNRGILDDLEVVPAYGEGARYWQYVSYAGSVTEELVLPNENRFWLDGDDGALWWSDYSRPPSHAAGQILGNRVRVQGAMLGDGGVSPSKPLKPRILTAAAEQVVVLDQPQKDDRPQTTRVRGFISYVGKSYFIACEVKIFSSMCRSLSADMPVEVDLVDINSESHQAQSVRINTLAGVKLLPAKLTSPAEIAQGGMASQLVSVEGTVRGCVVGRYYVELQLDQGADHFAAIIPRDPGQAFFETYSVGQFARLSGAVVYRSDFPEERFALYVSNPDDVVLSTPTVLLYRSQIAWCFAALLASVILVVGWHLSLRRRVAEKTKELSQLNTRVVAAATAVQNAILIVDQDDRVIQTNQKFNQMFGYFDDGAYIDQVFNDCIKQRFSRSNDFEEFWHRFPILHQGFGTQEFAVGESVDWILVTTASVPDDHGDASGRVWTFEDITERKRTEQENVQARKIQAVGRLAGGIAHDLNNLLQVVNANLQMIKLTICKDELQLSSQVDVASAAVERGAALTRQLLAFSSGSTIERKTTDLNEVVSQVFDLIDCVLDANVKVSVDLDQDVWPVLIDSGQIGQVIMNLCLNARDAIAEKQGSIKISTRRESGGQVGDAAGDRVVVAVEDDGCGMPEEVASRVFEPFFTTKDLSHGTGLGLSMAHGIMQQHDGRLTCRSTVGKGTRFEFHLPRCREELAVRDDERPLSADEGDTAGRILLVDDESMVRMAGQLLLNTLGYTVDVAGDGVDALEQLAADDRYDVVILDMTMPRMSGKETLIRIRDLRPEVKVIICSGYSAETQQVEGLNELRPDGFLAKPFRVDDFTKVIQRARQKPRSIA